MDTMKEFREIKLSKLQMDALKILLDNTHTSVGFGGGAGGGKTYLGAIRLDTMCRTYPGVRYAMVRNTIKNVKATTVKSLMKFYADYDMPQIYRGVLNEQKGAIRYRNGSEIVLAEGCYYPSDPLYNRFGSLELTGAFIEESAECPIEGIEIIQTRVGRQKNDEYGILGKVLETFNPNPGHVYDRYYKGNHQDGDKAIFIRALVNDNPFISEQYIQNLERASEQTKSRLLYGEWKFDDNAWMLFRMDDIHAMRTNPAKGDKYYLICDVARFGKDTTRISLREGNRRFRIKTYNKSSTTETIQAITYFVEQYKIDRNNVIVDADGVGGGVVDGLPHCRSFINNSRPLETGVRHNYANLKSQCAFLLQEKVQNHELCIDREHLDVDRDRHDLEEEMLNTYIDEKSIDGKTRIEPKEKIKERIGRSPDILDTLIMRMYPYLLGESDTTQYLDTITR